MLAISAWFHFLSYHHAVMMAESSLRNADTELRVLRHYQHHNGSPLCLSFLAKSGVILRILVVGGLYYVSVIAHGPYAGN